MVPTWTGPFLIRSRVPGSEHRYLLTRTETSVTFDAHVTRMKLAPKQTYGTVVHEAKAADGVGAGRGYHEMDSSLTLEIDRIVDVNRHSALVRFVGTELNDRWVTLEEMHKQGLADLLADFHTANGTTVAPGKDEEGGEPHA